MDGSIEEAIREIVKDEVEKVIPQIFSDMFAGRTIGASAVVPRKKRKYTKRKPDPEDGA